MNTKTYSILEKAGKLGIKKQADGTILLGRLPHIAPHAWFHALLGPLNQGNLKLLEKNLEREIPSYYKDLLKIHNGLILFSGSLSLDGYRKKYNRKSPVIMPFDLLTVNLYERPYDSLESNFFIGGYDWDGSLLYMNYDSPKIYRSSRDSVKPLNTWSNIDTMINKEVIRLNKLFKDGKQILKEEPTTPKK